MEIWVLVALTTGLANIVYEFAARKYLSKTKSPLAYTWWFSVVRLVLVTIILLFTWPQGYSTREYLLLLTFGLLNFINLYLFLNMHSKTELSTSNIITRLRLIWVPLFAYVFLGETLSALEFMGVLLLFFATLVVVDFRGGKNKNGQLLALTFSVSTAILTVILKAVSVFADPTTILVAMSAPTVLLIPFFGKTVRSALLVNARQEIRGVVTVALTSIVMTYLLVWALQLGESVSKVNAIIFTVSVLAVPTGILVLKERELIKRKIAATLLAVVGAYFLL